MLCDSIVVYCSKDQGITVCETRTGRLPELEFLPITVGYRGIFFLIYGGVAVNDPAGVEV